MNSRGEARDLLSFVRDNRLASSAEDEVLANSSRSIIPKSQHTPIGRQQCC